MKILVIILVTLACIAAFVVITGYMLPVKHRASRQVLLHASPELVYKLISDVERYPAWRKDVKSIEVLEGGKQFRETGSSGTILYTVESQIPDRARVTQIADKSLPFGGTWTYEITRSSAGTTLRITEDGEVYNPIFRFVSRFIISQHTTIDTFLHNTGATLGEVIQITN